MKFYGLAWASVGLLNIMLALNTSAFAAELNGFSIETHQQNVNITLYTDQKTTYSTEQQGKQFSIILPDTQLSKAQLENGLPIVIDNKNRFIGRAVPTEDGKVKVIVPNLPADEYQVTIHQSQNKEAIKAPVAEIVKPRPAIALKPAVATSAFSSKPVTSAPVMASHSVPKTNPSKLKLSPPSQSKGTIWNPYVYHPAELKNETSQQAALKEQTGSQTNPAEAPLNTLSMAETTSKSSPDPKNNDPLWYLHSLPNTQTEPAKLGQVFTDMHAISEKEAPSKSSPVKVPLPDNGTLKQKVQGFFQAIPRWLNITLGLFFGGIGLFTSIGALVLLFVLFNQTKQWLGSTLQHKLSVPEEKQVARQLVPPSRKENHLKASTYASRPRQAHLFQDSAHFQAMDYLKHPAANISQAIKTVGLLHAGFNQPQRTSQAQAKRSI